MLYGFSETCTQTLGRQAREDGAVSMNGQKTAGKGGMGFVGVLTLIFIVLKLTGNINWSWLWVLSPIWVTALLLVVAFGVILLAGRLKKGKW